MRSKRLIIFVYLFWLITPAFGQITEAKGIVELESNGCEIDEVNFSQVYNAARENTGEGSFLIAIARLGDGDRKASLNSQRLSAARQWLVDKAALPKNKLVLANGEKIKGKGRVEFYIGGRLTHIIYPKPNFGLCAECCLGK